MPRMFAYLISLCLVWAMSLASFQAHAAEEAPPLDIGQVQIRLDDLSPAWWSGFDKADPALKARFFDKLSGELTRELGRLNDPEARSQGEVLMEIFANLKTLSAKTLTVEPLPEIQSTYTLRDWLTLVRKQQMLASQSLAQAKELDAAQADLKLFRKDIAQALLDYRGTAPHSPERQRVALTVLQRQLQLLSGMEREARLKQGIAALRGNLQQLRAQVEGAFAALKGSPALIPEYEQRLTEIAQRLTEVGEEVHQFRLSSIRLEGEQVPLSLSVAMLTKKAEQTRLLSEQLRLEAELGLEKAFAADGIPVSETESNRLESLQQTARSHHNELNRLLEKLSLTNGELSEGQLMAHFKRGQAIREHLVASDLLLSETQLLMNVEQRLSKAQQRWWDQPVENLQKLASDSGKVVLGWFSYPLFSVSESPVTLTDLIRLVVILTAAIMLSRHLQQLLKRLSSTQSTLSEAALFTVGRIVHYVIVIAALVVGLSTLGIDFTNLALVAGALSVGIGFGLQSIFNNFISGLILLFERPFKVGDLVELESGLRGRIRSINVRSTQLNTWDNIDILVPNSEFISGRVTNYTFSDDVRRLHVPFGVAYGSDKELVRQAAIEAAFRVTYTLKSSKHKPDVWLVKFGDSSLDFELIVWINHNRLPPGMNPVALYLWEVESALKQHNIEIPFPQRDLHLRSAAPELLRRGHAGGADQAQSSEDTGPPAA